MFNSLSSRWQTLKTKYKKIIPFVLCFFIFFFNPSSVYAADWDSWKSFVMDPNVTNGQYWMEGTTSTNGNITISLEVIVSEHSVRFLGDVNSTGYNAGLFVINLPIHVGDVISFNVNSNEIYTRSRYGIKSNLDSTGLYTYNTNVNSDYVLYSEYLEGVIPEQTITFVSDSDGYLFFYSRLQAQAKVNTLFSNITINGGVVNLSPEEILNNGDADTQGIVDSANESNDLLNSVVSDYKDIEDSMLSNFNQYQLGILSDINSWSWGGLAACANWVGETMTNYYNNLGDFKQYIIYPLLLGIALFFIGRGSTIIGHLFRKPTVRTTFTESTSTRYRSGNHSGSSTSTTTYREGGVFRK